MSAGWRGSYQQQQQPHTHLTSLTASLWGRRGPPRSVACEREVREREGRGEERRERVTWRDMMREEWRYEEEVVWLLARLNGLVVTVVESLRGWIGLLLKNCVVEWYSCFTFFKGAVRELYLIISVWGNKNVFVLRFHWRCKHLFECVFPLVISYISKLLKLMLSTSTATSDLTINWNIC